MPTAFIYVVFVFYQYIVPLALEFFVMNYLPRYRASGTLTYWSELSTTIEFRGEIEAKNIRKLNMNFVENENL